MGQVTYITGHKNPDTDSICSVIAYAELKKKLGVEAIPVRLGNINKETEFVLNYFNIQAPQFLSTVQTQISDLDIDLVSPASPDISIKTAWMLMKRNNVKTMPVVDDNERLLGIVTFSDIANRYMDTMENNVIAASKAPLRNIVETVNGKLVCGSNADFNTTGRVVVAAMSSQDMEPYVEKGDIVIVGNIIENQMKSIELGAVCIIVTCGSKIEEHIIKAAVESKCIIISTVLDTFTTARLINQSIPIRYIMTSENLVKFSLDDFVDEIKDEMLETRYRSYPVVDDYNRIAGFVARYHLITQKRKKVILLDHNERSQTVFGIEQAEICEIIDHHRVGDIQTGNPIFFKNEPVGSTSTIIANLYTENGIRPSKSIAGILCAAILSDTIKFKSPTSTYIDKATAEMLAEIAEINIDEFAIAMFKGGSKLQGKKPHEIFYQDFKEYNLGKYKIGIGQINTLDIEAVFEMKEELLDYMDNLCLSKGYNLLMLLVTHILDENSEVLFTGEDKWIIEKAFRVKAEENSVHLPGVVSRKKQVVPHISVAVE